MDAAWLGKLNEQQRAAATFGNGPLLIVAGAGTGKTNTLAHRVAYLIAQGTRPARILLLTFTRRAAQEMLRRCETILAASSSGARPAALTVQHSAISKVWGGTFHSVANRLLRIYGQSLGLGETFTVLDRSDAEDLVNVVRSDLGLDKGEARFPRKGTCAAIYSRCVNAQCAVEDALKTHFPWCLSYPDQLKGLFRAYTQHKQQQNVLDYDDLLLYWFHMMQDENLAADVRRRFDAVLVDEYQDTNALQAAVLKRLCPDGRGLTAVGDDAQSIYSFRAATVHNILDFPNVYPGTEVLKLEQNYRSVQPILDATNAVIALCPKRYNKDLFSTRLSQQRPKLVSVVDEDQQCQYVIGEILQHLEAGIPLQKQAVLFRTAHHSDALEVELARRNIPFVKFGGLKFLEAAHVKDVLCILRLAENPRDLSSGLRVLQLMDGIGPSHARKAMTYLIEQGADLRAWEKFDPPPAAKGQWAEFVTMMEWLAGADCELRTANCELREPNSQSEIRNSESSSPETRNPKPETRSLPDQIAAVRRFYMPILEKRYDQAHIRARDIEQLEQISSNFRWRTQMLAELALDPPSTTQDLAGPPMLDEDFLILSTIHSAKGCEWDAVYVIHAADGNIPSDMSTGSDAEIEEERRLFYVALTRARDFLYVCVPQRYYFKKHARGDRHSYAQITRFLPESILDKFERVSMTPAPGADAGAAARPAGNIREKIASMWG